MMRKWNSQKNKKGRQIGQKKLVKCNLKLVVSIAKKYWNNKTVEFMDVIQEGNIGFQKAVKKYDGTKGYKFSTYATWWIKQSIQRYIGESLMIRVPVNAFVESRNLKCFCAEYYSINGFNPTFEEIVEHFDWTIEKTKNVFYSEKEMSSLDKPILESEDEGTLKDFIPDFTMIPQEIVEKKDSIEYLANMMNKYLSEREVIVLKYRYGCF